MSKDNDQKGLLYIPDISGFTKFINDTEIEHSQHIIKELLEVIIEANIINLQVSEIEGDAVLFYRFGKPPTAFDIAEQSKKMFIEFHKYLQIIERDRVCHCGACSTAGGLTLKILVHYGDMGLSDIKGHKQLIGKGVIIAHRLMKNDIVGNEYLLMTEHYFSKLQMGEPESQFNWDKVHKAKANYEHLGDILYHYIMLSELHNFIPAIEPVSQPETFPDPIKVETQIGTPMSFIYSIIINFDKRLIWTNGLRKIEFDKESIHRIGTKHICDLPGGKIKLETVQSNAGDNRISHVEKAQESLMFPEATTFFILKEDDVGTLFRIEFHYRKRKVLGKLIDIIFRNKLANGFIRSAKNLKELCESEFIKI